jgi:hypothetical protein
VQYDLSAARSAGRSFAGSWALSLVAADKNISTRLKFYKNIIFACAWDEKSNDITDVVPGHLFSMIVAY